VVSPVLAKLFLHYTFDAWMTRTFPGLPWCLYADDGLVHCKTETEALCVTTIILAGRIASPEIVPQGRFVASFKMLPWPRRYWKQAAREARYCVYRRSRPCIPRSSRPPFPI
jgi:hypothetical protein